MRVVAIGNDRIDEGDRLEPGGAVRDLEPDELVLVHDRASIVSAVGVEATAARTRAGVDLVVGAWTFVDPDHGIVQRRGVFSPERLRWSNTVGPAFLVSGRALQRSGWGSDAHLTMQDLLLRLSELDPNSLVVESIPTVLAHVEDVAATCPGLVGAVERHLVRAGIDAVVTPCVGHDRAVVVDRVVPDDLTVSLVVPTTGRITDVRGCPGRLVVNLLTSLYDITDFPRERLDVVLVVGPEADPELGDVVADRFGRDAVRFVATDEPFSHSRRTNRGVLASSADVVVLLNDDTEVLSPGWLGQIATVATEPGVGLVGPLLRYPDGSIQSAGHAHPHANISEPMAQVAPSQEMEIGRGRDVAGVTLACAAVTRRHYRGVGGLSSRIHNAFNDVDLAMKLGGQGLRHVSLGHVEMVHLETATRAPGVQGFEAEVLQQRWASLMTAEHLHFTDEIHPAAGT
jgi:GT2 family glycosyltransferase